jgi:copper chaperone CopZ
MMAGMTELTYSVPAMHCGNCTAAVEREVSQVEGVESVAADLETKRVVVRGTALDDAAVRAAIDEAGYQAA